MVEEGIWRGDPLERPGLGVRGCLGVGRKDQRDLGGKGLGEYFRRGKLRERIGVAGRDAHVQQPHTKISWKGPVWGVVVGALGVEGGGGGEG